MISGIPGYDFGSDLIAQSPVLLDDLELIQQTVGFTSDDEHMLRMAGEILAEQLDEVLDVWYGYFASQPHLMAYFSDAGGAPIQSYLDAVRRRFSQWILDTCNAPYDQDWLNYQNEIGLRHSAAKKNQTDNVESASSVPFSHIVAAVYPFTQSIRPFLAAKGHSEEDVEKMHHAWTKSVLIQVGLWGQAYMGRGQA